jgi:thiamine-monophosphate kinase
MAEQEIIERFRRAFPLRTGSRWRLGIGDDAALLRLSPGQELLLTCDASLEGVHFFREKHAPEVVGYRALARAVSDIAAMGGRPLCFLLTLALPAALSGRWLDRFVTGLRHASKMFHVKHFGGDTTHNSRIFISVTVLGEVLRGRAVLRSGARPGDLICVSGRLGEAQLGLELILKGFGRQAKWRPLLRKHLRPQPRLALGLWLANQKMASALIDVSDGLSTDLGHICDASGVGARVYADKIPQVRLPEELHRCRFDPLALGLHGGEDYELLFTVPRRQARRLPTNFCGTPLSVIGQVTRERHVLLVHPDGRQQRLSPLGWDPFRHPSTPSSAWWNRTTPAPILRSSLRPHRPKARAHEWPVPG